LFALALCSVGFTSTAAAQSGGPQLKVVEHIWGFDGRVQPGQFNPLSVLVDNQTSDAIDADITLHQSSGTLSSSGGQYVQHVFIAATGRRWIQFYPYIDHGYQTEWQLKITDDETRQVRNLGKQFTQARSAIEKDEDKKDPPPQVIILDKDRSSNRPGTVKHMPENIFPPYASATSGLHTVFLDHVPDWELPRQESFMSWLKLGGRLHLLQDSRGEFPRFSGAMAEINQPLTTYTIGYGAVERHSIRRNDVTEAIVRSAIVVDVLKGKDTEAEKAIRKRYEQYNQGLGDLIQIDASSIDDELFRKMRENTQPEHAWWLIFLLALIYIGLIFPGCFLLSKQNDLHFLTTYAAIIGLSVLFSLFFLMIGRRGYGESTNLQTMAIARAEDSEHWNVWQWNALFVTSGNDYSVTATDQQVLFSVADVSENAQAQVTPGNSGEAVMRIPPFSSQTFVSRRRVTSDPWNLQIVASDIRETGIVKLTLQPGKNFPIDEETEYMVLAGRSLSRMKYDVQKKQLVLFGSRQRLAEFCQPRFDYGAMNPWGTQSTTTDDRTETQIFYDDALPKLIQRSLMDDLVDTPGRFELPADRIRLFVYSPPPKDFDLSVSATAKRAGRILFVKDLFLNGDANN